MNKSFDTPADCINYYAWLIEDGERSLSSTAGLIENKSDENCIIFVGQQVDYGQGNKDAPCSYHDSKSFKRKGK